MYVSEWKRLSTVGKYSNNMCSDARVEFIACTYM